MPRRPGLFASQTNKVASRGEIKDAVTAGWLAKTKDRLDTHSVSCSRIKPGALRPRTRSCATPPSPRWTLSMRSLGGESRRDALQPLHQLSLPEKLRKTALGGGVKSTLGYKVVFNSRTGVLYTDQHVKIFISPDGLSPAKSMALHPKYITIGSPRGPLLTDETLRKLVLERVHRAGQALGWTLD
jgi:hypothetical protein